MNNDHLYQTIDNLSKAVHDLLIEIYARDQEFDKNTKKYHDDLVKAYKLLNNN